MSNEFSKQSKFKNMKDRLIGARVYSLFIILGLCLVISLGWGVNQYRAKKDYQGYLSNQFNRNFFALGDYVKNINTLLQKAPIASTSKERNIIYSDIWRQADVAQDTLGNLPINQQVIANASKYLKQVGDYNYMLLKKDSKGEPITKENIAQLKKYADYSQKLQDDLYGLTNSLEAGNIGFSDLPRKGNTWMGTASKGVQSSDKIFGGIKRSFVKYPSMIYDGPFSDHVVYSKMFTELKGNALSAAEAKTFAKDVLKEKNSNIVSISVMDTEKSIKEDKSIKTKVYYQNNNKNVKVEPSDVYSIQAVRKYNGKNENIYMEIGKKGKHLVSIINSKLPSSEVINMNEADKYGLDFLNKIGYKDMAAAYFQKYDNAVVINYVYKDNKGIVYYPDMIKVKVSLSNGEILSFDASGYLTYHKQRNAGGIKLTQAQAQKSITTTFDIKGADLAVIPLENKQEVLCYEFKGIYNKKYFIVYINAKTGDQENILQVIDTNRGKLVI